MAQFSAAQRGVAGTASTTQLNNGTLTMLTVGNIANVKMFSWGGSDTSLIPYSTRWARVTNTPATPTALTITASSPGITPVATVNTYTTTPTAAASPAGLFQQDWNSQGGGGAIVLPIGGEWRISGGALGTVYSQIGCGNVVGASANSSFGWVWDE
jgi:hypothetical protein